MGEKDNKETAEAVLEYKKVLLERYIEEQKYLLKESNLPEDLIMYDWKDYKFDDNEQVDDEGNKVDLSDDVIASRREVWRACGNYCLNLQKMNDEEDKEYPFASMLLIGTKGSGKSVLGSLILREAMKRLREKVFYVPFGTLSVELAMGSWDKHIEFFEKTYCSPKVLMIDEICEGYYIGNRARDNLNYILTRRANSGYPTIITSKTSYESLYHVTGIPAYMLIGKKEVYKHFTIMNTARTNPAVLLTADSKYPRGKVDTMIRRLEILKEINLKNNSSVALYGDQIRNILDGAVRGNVLTDKQFNKMANIAKGIPVQKTDGIQMDEIDDVDKVLSETSPKNTPKKPKSKKEKKESAKEVKEKRGLGG